MKIGKWDYSIAHSFMPSMYVLMISDEEGFYTIPLVLFGFGVPLLFFITYGITQVLIGGIT